MKDKFFKTLDEIFKQTDEKNICVALSGGADSSVLAHIVKTYADKKNKKIFCCYVNHKLRKEADIEAKTLTEKMKKENIFFEVLQWQHKGISKDIENQARIARYNLIKDFAAKYKCKIIMTAHHKDDQIETFLMNLSRGSGVYGLAGIRLIQTQDNFLIIRPLLDFSKAEILEYAKKNNIKFFHDKMNDDEQFLRVKIRKNRYLLSDKLEISDDKIIKAMNNFLRVKDMCEDLVDKHLKNSEKGKNTFEKSTFLQNYDEILLRSLGKIITDLNNLDYMPELNKLENLLQKIKESKLPSTLGGIKIYEKNNKIVFEKLK